VLVYSISTQLLPEQENNADHVMLLQQLLLLPLLLAQELTGQEAEDDEPGLPTTRIKFGTRSETGPKPVRCGVYCNYHCVWEDAAAAVSCHGRLATSRVFWDPLHSLVHLATAALNFGLLFLVSSSFVFIFIYFIVPCFAIHGLILL
jgi:hypothetical protein